MWVGVSCRDVLVSLVDVLVSEGYVGYCEGLLSGIIYQPAFVTSLRLKMARSLVGKRALMSSIPPLKPISPRLLRGKPSSSVTPRVLLGSHNEGPGRGC